MKTIQVNDILTFRIGENTATAIVTHRFQGTTYERIKVDKIIELRDALNKSLELIEKDELPYYKSVLNPRPKPTPRFNVKEKTFIQKCIETAHNDNNKAFEKKRFESELPEYTISLKKRVRRAELAGYLCAFVVLITLWINLILK